MAVSWYHLQRLGENGAYVGCCKGSIGGVNPLATKYFHQIAGAERAI